MQRQGSVLRKLNINDSNHPGVTLALLIFKGAPIFMYLFSGFIFNSEILVISVITVIAAMDFWFTKNIAGRLMVGLLWEREILPDGRENFIYECNGDETKNNKSDSFFFWTTQYISCGFWLVMIIMQIMSFSVKVVITCVPASLALFNLYAFYNCSSEQQKLLKGAVNQGRNQAGNAAMNYAVNNPDVFFSK